MRKGVLILSSYYEAMEDLPDSDRLQLFDCLMRYGLYGEEAELPAHLRGYFALMRPTLDSTLRRYDAARDNGMKGGRPPKNQSDNQNDNQNDNQTQNLKKEKEKEKEKETETETERDTRGGPDPESVFEHKRKEALEALDRLCGPFPPAGEAAPGKPVENGSGL